MRGCNMFISHTMSMGYNMTRDTKQGIESYWPWKNFPFQEGEDSQIASPKLDSLPFGMAISDEIVALLPSTKRLTSVKEDLRCFPKEDLGSFFKYFVFYICKLIYMIYYHTLTSNKNYLQSMKKNHRKHKYSLHLIVIFSQFNLQELTVNGNCFAYKSNLTSIYSKNTHNWSII